MKEKPENKKIKNFKRGFHQSYELFKVSRAFFTKERLFMVNFF